LRTGKRPFLVPKDLALQQVRRNRTAIEHDERTLGPRAALVKRVRDELFAGTSFALDEDGDVRGRRAVDDRVELPHRQARPDERTETI